MRDCSIDVGIEEYPDMCSSEILTARIPHKCCECRCEIKPGQRYERATLLIEGFFSHYKTCMPCKSIRDDLFCNWFYGHIWEDVKEHFDNAGVQEPDDYDWSWLNKEVFG